MHIQHVRNECQFKSVWDAEMHDWLEMHCVWDIMHKEVYKIYYIIQCKQMTKRDRNILGLWGKLEIKGCVLFCIYDLIILNK